MLDFFLNDPLLNLLQLFFNLVNDIGFAIILLAGLLNLALFPLFRDSYITGQKMKVLAPELRKIQEKYRQDPANLIAKSREFNKKHDIKNGSMFLAIILQIVFFTALYFLIRNVSNGDNISGLYQSWYNSTQTTFPTETVIGNLNIGDKTAQNVWLAFLVAGLTWFQSLYTFRLAKRPKLPIPDAPKKELKPGQFDPAAFQKTMEKFSIYILPILFFFINMTLTVGVTLYFVASSMIAIFRQFVLSTFYTNHIEKLFDDIAKSDPTSVDENPDNNIEKTAEVDFVDVGPVATKVNRKDIKLQKKIAKKKKKAKKK